MKEKRSISGVLLFIFVCSIILKTSMIKGFANYESKTITINFDSGDGEGVVPETITAFEGEIIKLPLSTLTKEDHILSWWSDGIDIYSQGGNYTVPAANVTLTAQFKASRSKQVLHSLDTLNGVWGATPVIAGEDLPKEGAGYVQTTGMAGEPVQICAMWDPLDISAYTGSGYLHFSLYIDDVTKINQDHGHGFVDILPDLNDYEHSWTINYDPAQLQNGWNEVNIKLSEAYLKNTDLKTARMFRYVQYVNQDVTIALDDFYVWMASPSYDIIFRGNGATSGSSRENAINKSDLAPGTQITLPENIYFRDGYKFIGWSDGNEVYRPLDKYAVVDKCVRFDAQWEKINDFTGDIEISFSSDGAMGYVPAPIYANKGDVIILPDNPFTKDGYSFTWWTDGIEVYSQGSGYIVKDTNVVFTPLWKKSGTKLMIDSLDDTKGIWGVGQIQAGTIAPAEGSGYVQCTSFGTDPIIICNMLQNKDISAFEQNGYLHISVYVEDAVKLNTNPGGGMIELWETTDGSKVYSFDLSKHTLQNGWNELDFAFSKDAASNSANLSSIIMFRFFQHVLESTTLGLDNIYVWKSEDTYDVIFTCGIFDSVTGDVSLINKSNLNPGTIIEMPNNIYKRTGYRFVGWSDGENVYRPREEYVITNKNIRFEAQWIKSEESEEIEISFYKGDAIGEDPEPIYAPKGSTIILPMNPYTNGDLDFQWWSDGISMYSQGGAFTVPESDVVLAPVWKSGGTKLVIDNMDSVAGYWGVSPINLSHDKQLEGSGYIWANAGPVGDEQAVIFCRVWPEPIDISAFYETGYFHVSVYVEDVTKLDNTELNRALIELYDSPQTQTNIWDYSLANKDLKNGWNEINFSIKNDAIRHEGDLSHITNFRYFHYVTQNVVIGIDDFYVWMPENSHDLMFAGGGADAKYASDNLNPTIIKAIKTGSEYILPFNMYKKEGYKFIGWSDGINIYQGGSTYIMPNQSVRFDAKWEKLDDVKITYSNGGTEGSISGGTAYEGKRIRIAENNFNKTGYSFVGWNDGRKTYSPGVIYTMPANDVTFTAQWEPISDYDLLNEGDTLEAWQLNDGGLADVLSSAIDATKAIGRWGWWLPSSTFGTVLDMSAEGSYYVAKESNVNLGNRWTMVAWIKLPPRPLNDKDRIIFSQSKTTAVEYTDYYTLESCDSTSGWQGFPGSGMTTVTIGQKEGSAYLKDNLTPVSVFKRVFDEPIDLSRYIENGYINLWIYIDDVNKIVDGSSRVEISHDLTDPIDYGDANFWTVSGFTTGWNYLQLPIKDSSKFGNGADFSQIRYFRFFQYTTEKTSIGIDDVTLCNLKEQPPKDEWKFYVSAEDGALNFSSATLQGLVSSGINIVDNKWHHVMVAMNDNKIYYWIDGENVKTVEVTGDNLNVGTTDFYIGNNSDGTECLDGSIAEVRVFNENKTPVQVTRTVLNPDDNIRKDTKLPLKKGVMMEIRSFFGQHYSNYEVYDPNKNVTPLNVANVDTAILLGFDHIKFCIAPNNLIDNNGSLIVENMTYITRNINMTIEKDIPVILCMHPEGDFKNKYLGNLKNFEKLVKWYSELAAYIGEHWSPDEVALQIMTEPFGNSSAVRWDWQSDRQALAVRNVLPEYTILTSSDQAGNLEKLKEMSPATDDNLIYTFTTYEPYTIGWNTAGPGMSGTIGPQSYFGDIPYPAPQDLTEAEIDELIERLIEKVPDSMKQQGRDYLKPYFLGIYDTNPIFKNNYDVGYVREWNYKRMESLNKWSEANGGKIHIACVEFGMMDKTTAIKYYGAAEGTGISHETRYDFIHDLRDAFERYGIGWVYWHWNGTFTVFDPETRIFYSDVAPKDLEFCYDGQLIEYSLGLTPKWKEDPSIDCQVGIKVTPPAKTTYYIGDVFDTTGMKVEKVMKSGAKAEILPANYTSEGVSIEGFDSSKEAASQTITVKHVTADGAFEDTFIISIKAKTTEETSIITPPIIPPATEPTQPEPEGEQPPEEEEKPEEEPEEPKEEEKPEIVLEQEVLPDGTIITSIKPEELQKIVSETPKGNSIEIKLSDKEISDSIKVAIPKPLYDSMENKDVHDVKLELANRQISISVDKLKKSGIEITDELEIVVSPEKGTANILINNKPIEFAPFENPIKIAVEYPVKNQNVDYIVAYNQDEKGNKVIVPMSYYEDGKVYFPPASSGIVGFMYNEIEFKDTEGRWMNDDVKYLASRGVIKGIGGGMFAPDANIIRADAVTMIVRMLDLNAGSNDNFADVDPAKYYADAVATAKALGIVNGVGGNMFKPDAEIIREDIFVILYRAMAKYQKIPETPQYKNIIFNDQDQIADYAKEAVETFVKMGIIQGNGGYLKPKDKATRGEVAKMLRNIMEYFMK